MIYGISRHDSGELEAALTWRRLASISAVSVATIQESLRRPAHADEIGLRAEGISRHDSGELEAVKGTVESAQEELYQSPRFRRA